MFATGNPDISRKDGATLATAKKSDNGGRFLNI
jgi:hypothetical protein